MKPLNGLRTHQVRDDFPVLRNNPHLVYLDSTATSLKPQCVIDKINEYYSHYSANIHRGIYELSDRASSEYERSRELVARYIHASYPEEIVFVRNTTEALNLLAYALGREILDKGDEVVSTIADHHSNFIPWQQLATEVGAVFKVIDVNEQGKLELGEPLLNGIVTKRTKILALPHISNVLGIRYPVKEIIAQAKKINPDIITIVDAAQSAPHTVIDVQDIGCDFLAFSGHKMLGPTGVGALYGTSKRLTQMSPFLFGGGMVENVELSYSSFQPPPAKFEAGTPAIGEVIALRAAVEYLEQMDLKEVERHEKELVTYATSQLMSEFGDTIHILGDICERFGIISFTFGDHHPHDIAQILSDNNVAVRAGHHCAIPLHKRYGIQSSCRASFYIYNTHADADALVAALHMVNKILG